MLEDNKDNVKIGVEENDKEAYSDQVQPIGKSQKIAVAVLAFFAILVIIFWAVQFKTTLNNSLKHNSTAGTENSGNSGDVMANEANKNNEALKTKDTDSDSLSDWDELNVYKTSPYLEDSDSDGYSDKKEIDSDNDPNCPMGTTCSEIDISETNQAEAQSTSQNAIDELNSSSQSGNNDSSNVNTNSNGEQGSLVNGEVDAKTLRSLLKQSGFDQAELDKISDEELLKVYQEATSQQKQNE